MAKLRINTSPDGKVYVFYQRGTFEQGKKEIQKVLRAIVGADFEFTEEITSVENQVEQHRHDDPEAVHQTHMHYDGSYGGGE